MRLISILETPLASPAVDTDSAPNPKRPRLSCLVVHACKPKARQAEAGGSNVLGQCGLCEALSQTSVKHVAPVSLQAP